MVTQMYNLPKPMDLSLKLCVFECIKNKTIANCIKNIKYLGIDLMKDIQDCYIENFGTLLTNLKSLSGEADDINWKTTSLQ